MDGVAVARALLIADAGMTALVPASRIVGGTLPLGVQLDAISITRVSATDRNIPAPGTERHVTERVQVTVLAASYPRAKAAVAAAKAVLADFIGSAAGLTKATIHTDLAGPDFMDEQASIYVATQDFIVGYAQPR